MTPLKEKILGLIRENGPISLAHFMTIALLDPEHGYYMKRVPLGRDFITAPEVSQIFGELISLFFVQAWEDRGRPETFRLVELGPGRGTLMADLLRAAKIRPGFVAAAHIELVEMSRSLRDVQALALGTATPNWRQDFRDVPDDGPLFLVANEFFDALPARQFVRSPRGWHERMVGVDGDGLVFAAAPDSLPVQFIPPAMGEAPVGTVFETSPHSHIIVREIARRIARSGGVALIIDYGYAAGSGDSFQAVKAHRYTDPLAEPGEADLTFHVDFDALAGAAQQEGAAIFGPVTQAAFLESLGIAARAERLTISAPGHAAEMAAAIDRLTGAGQMGTLFKALAISKGRSPMVPGFPC